MGEKDKEKEQIVPWAVWVWISTCRRESLHFFLGHIFFCTSKPTRLHRLVYSVIQARANTREDAGYLARRREMG